MAYGLLNDYLLGQTIDAYKYFGAHKEIRDGVEGYVFRLYAPMAKDVSIIGEFNNWNPAVNKMNMIDISGTWEIFIPGVKNYQTYKFHFLNAKNNYVDKADPFAFFSDYKPGSCSRIFDYTNFIWHDLKYMQKRTRNFDKPMSIYELHVGSWKGQVDNRNLSYEEVADYLIPYVKEHGFTHVELMPIVQYPFDGSWGYQATGFFSVDSRYGNPKQLMSFVDRMHQENIGVILDFAPVHFAVDDFGLIDFDGDYLFESKDPNRRFSQWGSVLFDLGKDPVRSFLMSAMNYFTTEFHFDGIRMDAVSNIIFYDGNKDLGENHGAIEFLKRTNSYLHNRHSSLMMIAEDSSDYYGVTKPLDQYGLGFDYKWDLGWMNDTLKYYHLDPIYKKYDHNKLTFSMAYYFNENFMLPFSHDEVVHGKGTLINKMWGNYEQKFALLRNLFTYQFAHPGKKLNFMSNELGSFDEWSEKKSLPWVLKTFPAHDSISRLVRDLNLIYAHEKAMYLNEYNPNNFRWIMVDNADQSIFAFERFDDTTHLLFVFNMTPNFYENYDLGVIEKGNYHEIFNSDKDVYGGYNQYNGLPLKAKKEPLNGKPYRITIKIASFGAMIFKLKKYKKSK